MRYRKVRQLHILCQLDLCRHNIRYGCLKKDECIFAHSDIELKTWRLQRETGAVSKVSMELELSITMSDLGLMGFCSVSCLLQESRLRKS